MSKSAGFLVLLAAILSGVIASAAVVNYARQQNNQSGEVLAAESVAILTETVPAGSRILSSQVALTERQPETIPENAIRSTEKAVGRIVKSTLYPGEIVLVDRLVDPGAPAGLPALIPKDMRAITLRVDDTISVAGFVRPGHHVDVLTTLDVDSDLGQTVSKTILQNVSVIATGREIEESAEKKKAKVVPTVTVLVTLEQAERLALASNAGTIRLVLRSHDDNKEVKTEGVTLHSLIPQANRDFSLPEPVMVKETEEPESREVRIVEVYRGVEKSELSFAK